MYDFDGTENEYCLRCHKKNEIDNPVCECGSTSFIFGYGIKPLEDRYVCECGRDLGKPVKIAYIHINISEIHETYYKCQCGNVWGTQIKIKGRNNESDR